LVRGKEENEGKPEYDGTLDEIDDDDDANDDDDDDDDDEEEEDRKGDIPCWVKIVFTAMS
jgi:hypothetical protein